MPKMKYPPDVIDSWFEALKSPCRELTRKEENFLISVGDQWERNRFLTEPQIECLEDIYARKTD